MIRLPAAVLKTETEIRQTEFAAIAAPVNCSSVVPGAAVSVPPVQPVPVKVALAGFAICMPTGRLSGRLKLLRLIAFGLLLRICRLKLETVPIGPVFGAKPLDKLTKLLIAFSVAVAAALVTPSFVVIVFAPIELVSVPLDPAGASTLTLTVQLVAAPAGPTARLAPLRLIVLVADTAVTVPVLVASKRAALSPPG